MIHLTQMNGKKFVLNAEMIETIESTPDTIITLINGRKIVVLESIDDVVDKVIEYKKKAYPIESLLRFLPEIRR